MFGVRLHEAPYCMGDIGENPPKRGNISSSLSSAFHLESHVNLALSNLPLRGVGGWGGVAQKVSCLYSSPLPSHFFICLHPLGISRCQAILESCRCAPVVDGETEYVRSKERCSCSFQVDAFGFFFQHLIPVIEGTRTRSRNSYLFDGSRRRRIADRANSSHDPTRKTSL